MRHRTSHHLPPLGCLLVTGGLLSSCGGTAPSAPPPTPLTSRAFVHVLDPKAQVLSTFEVSGATGRLAPVATVSVPGATWVSADPRGRVVYTLDDRRASIGTRTYRVGSVLRTWSVDGLSGAIALRAEVEQSYGPDSLAVSADRVFAGGTWRPGTGQDFASRLDAYEIRPDSALVPATGPRDVDGDDRHVNVFANAAASLVYVVTDFLGTDMLTSHVPAADGTFVQQGKALYLDERESTGLPVELVVHTAAVVGEVLVVTWHDNLVSFTVDRAAQRLRAGAVLTSAVTSRKEISAIAAGPSGLLAVAAADGVRLFGVDASGEISRIAEALVPVRGDLAFHPSGRFLYVCTEGGLTIYQVDRGSLVPFALESEVPPGRIEVTSPAS